MPTDAERIKRAFHGGTKYGHVIKLRVGHEDMVVEEWQLRIIQAKLAVNERLDGVDWRILDSVLNEVCMNHTHPRFDTCDMCGIETEYENLVSDGDGQIRCLRCLDKATSIDEKGPSASLSAST